MLATYSSGYFLVACSLIGHHLLGTLVHDQLYGVSQSGCRLGCILFDDVINNTITRRFIRENGQLTTGLAIDSVSVTLIH